MRAAWAALGCLATVVAAPAWAGVDFAVESTDWNGMAGLGKTAKETAVDLVVADRLDFAALEHHDVLMLVAPNEPPTRENADQLQAFLRSGGHVLVADDFRAGRAWLQPYGIDWLDEPGRSRRSYDNNPELPMVVVDPPAEAAAVAKKWHGPQSRFTPAEFLGHNVKDGIVLNHPAALQGGKATATWGRFDGGGGWLVEFSAGHGRGLAIADSSVFLNQMLGRVYDNRQFAANALRYYCVEGRTCRVRLVANLREAFGKFNDAGDDGKPTWRTGLEMLAVLLRDVGELLRGGLAAPGLVAMVLLLIGMPVVRRARVPAGLLPPRSEMPRQSSALGQKLQAWLREPMADYRKPAQLLANQMERLLERAQPGMAGDRARMASAPQRRSGSWRRDNFVDGLVHGGRWSPQAGERLQQVLKDLQTLAQDHAPMVSRQQFGVLAAEVEWAESLLRHTMQQPFRQQPHRQHGRQPHSLGTGDPAEFTEHHDPTT